MEEMMSDDLRYLDWPRKEWRKSKNPIFPWIALVSCYKHGDVPPDWTLKYLAECGEKLLSLDTNVGDLGRKLPRILGFKSGQAGKHQLKEIARLVEDEKISMQFARNIFKRMTPSEARRHIEGGNLDDRKIRPALKRHFQFKRAPYSNHDWQLLIFASLCKDPSYQARYPDVPRLDKLAPKIAQISRKK
jgi:hypothetical protein